MSEEKPLTEEELDKIDVLREKLVAIDPDSSLVREELYRPENVQAAYMLAFMSRHLVAEVRRLRAELDEMDRAHAISFHNEMALRQTAPRADVILADVHRALRIACDDLECNDWPDDLHPADVISKYLVRAIEARRG